MKPIALALALCSIVTTAQLAHSQVAGAPANKVTPQTPECLKYQPESVQLIGHLENLTFPGGPSFTSLSQGDTPETGYYLRLAHRVCTIADKDKDAKADVALLQLVADSADLATLRPLVDKEIIVHGTLLPATNGHHHTPVILMPALPVTLYRAP